MPDVPNSAPPRLLIVDDDARIRELAEFAARSSGEFGGIELAADGVEALELLHRDPLHRLGPRADLILTDLSMPRLNGFELVARLREDPLTRHIPVVMFSSSGLPYDRERAIAAGCRAFFEKPAGLPGLTAMMHTVAELWRHESVPDGRPPSNVPS